MLKKMFFIRSVRFNFVSAMKFYDKYPQLKEKEFLTRMLIDTVFSTMLLENQEVSKQKLEG